jgi:hypothetical protein
MVEAEKPIRAGIGEKQPAAAIYRQHGLVHCAQDHQKLLAALIEMSGLFDHVRGRLVERVDQSADRPAQRGSHQPRPDALAEPLEPIAHLDERLMRPTEKKSGCR